MEFEYESSPLRVMGYIVGEKGDTAVRRREILRSAIEDQWSSRVRREVPEDQLKQWGDPGQDRYRKVVAKLTSQIDLFWARRDRRRMSEAIRQWEDDLRWLRETFGEKYRP